MCLVNLYGDPDTDEMINIKEMIKRHPKWVASRFTHMEKRISDMKEEILKHEGVVITITGMVSKCKGCQHIAHDGYDLK